MTWINLPTIEGESHWFNSDNIFRIYPYEGGAFIDTVCTGLYGTVKETPQEIIDRLAPPQRMEG